jgi:hypothetical protein
MVAGGRVCLAKPEGLKSYVDESLCLNFKTNHCQNHEERGRLLCM